MNEMEKWGVLLPHWIEHHKEHAGELRDWAERIQLAGRTDVAERLRAAAASLRQTRDHLSHLLDEIEEMTGT